MAQADDTVWLPVLPSMKDFGPALAKGAAADAEKVGKSTGLQFGKALTVGVLAVGAGAVAAGTALYKVGEVFDDVTDTIRTGTGATGKDLDAMVASAKRVGQNVPAEFSAIGTTIADVNTRMGLSGKTLETVASQYLEAGRVLGEDVDITKTSAAFNAFKIEGEDVIGAMDHLFQVSQATGVGMNDLAAAASRNAPAMQTLGFSFEETTAMVGSFDKAGLNSSQIMASMSKGLVTLAKDGEDPKKAFERVTGEIGGFIKAGDEASALELASKVFGTRGATQFIGALKSGTLNLDDMSRAAGQTGDTILGVGEDTADFAEEWQKFKNNVLVWLEPMGARVFGALGTLMGEVVTGVGAFGAAWESNSGKFTSSGIPGVMERLGYFARQTFEYVRINVVPVLKNMAAWVVENKGALLSLIPAIAAGAAVFGTFLAVTKAMAGFNSIITFLKATTLAQQGLNAALRANPIGLVVTALAALVAAGVWAYQNVAWFQDGVNTAWRVIQSVVQFAWTRVIQPVFQALVGFVRNVLGPIVTWLYRSVVQPVFGWIGDRIRGVWEGIIRPVFMLLRDIFRNVLGPAFSWFYEKIVRPVFKSVGGWISDTWKKTIQPILSAFGAYFEKHLGPKVRAGIDLITRLWDGLRVGFATPINWVIRTVWNNGIVKAFEAVAKAVESDAKLGTVPEIALGQKAAAYGSGRGRGATQVGAYAKGGKVKEEWYLAGEEGPELIHRGRDSHRVYTAAQTAAALAAGHDLTPELAARAAGSSPQQALVPMGGNVITDTLGAIGKGVSWVVGELAQGARRLLDPLIDGALSQASRFGMAGQMAAGVARKAADVIFGWAGRKDDEAGVDGSYGGTYDGPPGSWHRPSRGPITSWYGPRWGTVHAGVDIAGGGPTFASRAGKVAAVGWNIVKGRTGKGILLNHGPGWWSYYGHNPANGVLVSPGQTVRAGQRIGAQGNTGNVVKTGPGKGIHVHYEEQKGRVGNAQNINALFRDTGGSVPHGLNLVWNDTGRDELMLNHQDAIRTADRLRDGSRIPGTMIVRIGEQEFTGYVERISDNRLESHIPDLQQQVRQYQGARRG